MKVKLGDVCERGSSNLKQSDVIDCKGRYPVYGASGQISLIDFYHQDKPYIAVVKDGAGVGRTYFLPEKTSVIGTMQYLIPKDNVIPEYLYYVVKHMRLEKYYMGAAIPHIYFKDYKNEVFEIASREKQEEIVRILQSLENVIALRNKELLELEELIKSRFVEMFGDESNSMNWPIVKVKDVASVQVGVVIKPAQYYTDADNGVKTFRSLNIGPMYIKNNDWVYFTNEGNEKNSKSILKENDLIIVRSGAPGTACVVTKEYEGCNAVDIIIAHPDKEKVNPYYLCAYTNFPHGKRQIDEGTGGAAQQHFNVGKYNDLKLMLPPIEKQNEFYVFLNHIDKLKGKVQKSLDETQTLFDSLMQEYFG